MDIASASDLISGAVLGDRAADLIIQPLTERGLESSAFAALKRRRNAMAKMERKSFDNPSAPPRIFVVILTAAQPNVIRT